MIDRSSIALVVFLVGTVCMSFVLGANIYEQVVCVPKWRTLAGLQAWRAFTGDLHAGYFFLTFAPAGLVFLAIGTALGWSQSPARNPYALYATLVVLGVLIFTRVYFIPRNVRLFLPTGTQDEVEATTLISEWVIANYFRVAFMLTALVSALIAARR
jgi:hypothetical protein